MIKKIIFFFLKKSFPIYYARLSGVRVGSNCRLSDVSFGSEPYLVWVGDRVSATNVTFITHDGSVWIYRKKYPNIDIIKPIIVGNNVFLGYGVIILPGVQIGNNCIVGAGSIVTKSIPDNSVACGVPAKIIKTTDQYLSKNKIFFLHTKKLSSQKKKCFLVKKYRNFNVTQ